MGFFKRSETVRAKMISARARYVDEDVQRVDVSITNDAGETATIDLSLDQTRQLVIDRTNGLFRVPVGVSGAPVGWW